MLYLLKDGGPKNFVYSLFEKIN